MALDAWRNLVRNSGLAAPVAALGACATVPAANAPEGAAAAPKKTVIAMEYGRTAESVSQEVRRAVAGCWTRAGGVLGDYAVSKSSSNSSQHVIDSWDIAEKASGQTESQLEIIRIPDRPSGYIIRLVEFDQDPGLTSKLRAETAKLGRGSLC